MTTSPDSHSATSGTTVVIIEDNAANALLLRRIFTGELGFDVLTEGDGLRGLELIREQLPDLAVLDLNLPTMDGEAIVRALRAEPATAELPVIVVSGDATDETSERLREAGATTFLTKPFGVRALIDTVSGLLGGR